MKILSQVTVLIFLIAALADSTVYPETEAEPETLTNEQEVNIPLATFLGSRLY